MRHMINKSEDKPSDIPQLKAAWKLLRGRKSHSRFNSYMMDSKHQHAVFKKIEGVDIQNHVKRWNKRIKD
jgi:hypothetical protein